MPEPAQDELTKPVTLVNYASDRENADLLCPGIHFIAEL
jgi:hypothetical protein